MSEHVPQSGNPFRPPQQRSEFQRLAPDTEFLISGECILCHESVELPKVCIRTGAVDEVIKQQATLTWLPRWLRVICQALGIWALLVTGRYPWLTQIPEMPVFLIGGGLAVLVLILAPRLQRRVNVTWYVDKKLYRADKRRKLLRRGGFIILTVVYLGIVILREGTSVGYLSNVILVFLCGILLFGFTTRSRNNPMLIGIHHDLNVLSGFSLAFLSRLHNIIHEHARPK